MAIAMLNRFLSPRFGTQARIAWCFPGRLWTPFGLLPIDHKPACGVNGRYDSPAYVVDVMLPNRMKIQGVRVSLGAMEVADMLIGMDVISMGDFKLINDGKTSFSIRTPS